MTVENQTTREKTSPSAIYPPYVPHRLASDRTTDSVVRTATNHLSHGMVLEWQKFHNAGLQIRNFHTALLH